MTATRSIPRAAWWGARWGVVAGLAAGLAYRAGYALADRAVKSWRDGTTQ